MLVAADAADRLAWLHGQEALHPFDGEAVLIEGGQDESPHGRHFQAGRPVGLHRYRSQDSIQIEGVIEAVGIGLAAEIDRLRQRLHDEQLLDLTAFDPVHVASLIDVGEHQDAGRLCRGRAGTG